MRGLVVLSGDELPFTFGLVPWEPFDIDEDEDGELPMPLDPFTPVLLELPEFPICAWPLAPRVMVSGPDEGMSLDVMEPSGTCVVVPVEDDTVATAWPLEVSTLCTVPTVVPEESFTVAPVSVLYEPDDALLPIDDVPL